MTKLTPDDVARVRAAKRAIVDTMILVAVALPAGDTECAKAIKSLRAAHRCLRRRLDADKEKAGHLNG